MLEMKFVDKINYENRFSYIKHIFLLLLQAVPGTASTDGMDPGGRGPHRTPPKLLCGQRRCTTGSPTAVTWGGLWAAAAEVGLEGNVTSIHAQKQDRQTRYARRLP